jgi:hypothetical protein
MPAQRVISEAASYQASWDESYYLMWFIIFYLVVLVADKVDDFEPTDHSRQCVYSSIYIDIEGILPEARRELCPGRR